MKWYETIHDRRTGEFTSISSNDISMIHVRCHKRYWHCFGSPWTNSAMMVHLNDLRADLHRSVNFSQNFYQSGCETSMKLHDFRCQYHVSQCGSVLASRNFYEAARVEFQMTVSCFPVAAIRADLT